MGDGLFQSPQLETRGSGVRGWSLSLAGLFFVNRPSINKQAGWCSSPESVLALTGHSQASSRSKRLGFGCIPFFIHAGTGVLDLEREKSEGEEV